MTDFKSLFQSVGKLKVAIVGDVMLDTYWWGKVDRISPEGPVPIVALHTKEERIGGAGNVAINTAELQAKTTVFSVIGDDEDGIELSGLLEKHHVDAQYLVKDAQRPTTNKIRIMGRNQQMMRIDNETLKPISAASEAQLLSNFQQYVEKEKPHVVILEDYNKGVMTPTVIAAIIHLCKTQHIVTTVDPKKQNFFAYKGVDIFKPNLKEVIEALNINDFEVNAKNLSLIHEKLYKELHHKVSFITLSEKGVFFEMEDQPVLIPGYIRNIADVSGAGDTVIAVASLIFAATNDMQLAASIANIAGGLVCEEVGTAAIHKDALIDECKLLLI